MKLSPKIPLKSTNKLFNDQYHYKAVLITPYAHYFRGKNISHTEKMLSKNKNVGYYLKNATQEDKEHALKLCGILNEFEDYNLRVESPFLNFYSNSFDAVKKITDLDPEKVKYVSLPDIESMEPKAVYSSKLDYDFKVTMGKTTKSYESFIKWCENNPKIRMPKRCSEDLMETFSFGGGHFYVKDAKTLTVVRMFLGDGINRIYKVIKK